MTQPVNPGDPQPNQGHPSRFGQQQPYHTQQPYQGQPNPGYPPAPAPKKRKKWPWISLALVVLFPALVGGCMALVGGAAVSIDEESKRTVTVTYEITGDGATGSATYTTGDLDMAQDTDVPVPW
ncbi:hypothetical protein [Gordonia aurantiaca]|uniref:hypothetical protein n=1 Tax=Gordonia sp. B21 TaxID=3151852 RepID=UPI0032630333